MDFHKVRAALELRTSLQNRLDIVDVIARARPCARLTLRRQLEAGNLARNIVQIGLSIAVGHYYQHHPICPINGYVDEFGSIANLPSEEMICLYISQQQETAEESRKRDELRDDAQFGISLGYPKCCVDFMSGRGSVPRLTEIFSLYAADGFYHPLAWPGALIHDAALTVNYPCTSGCSQSRAMALNRWERLKGLSDRPLIDRIVRAHAATYWLSEEGAICSSFQRVVPSRCKAVAHPVEGLDL